MLLCKYCIEEIRSRGEIIYVSPELNDAEKNDKTICEWCDEEDDTLFECHF